MKRALLVLLLAPSACGDPAGPSVDASCFAAVNVHGVLFGSGPSGATVDPSTVAAEPYLTVTLDTGCLDQGEPPVELKHGESNFLAVGTTLHPVDGFAPTERLVHWSDVVYEWLVLSPHPAAQQP